jgi:hypothetical protein
MTLRPSLPQEGPGAATGTGGARTEQRSASPAPPSTAAGGLCLDGVTVPVGRTLRAQEAVSPPRGSGLFPGPQQALAVSLTRLRWRTGT